MDVNSYLNSGLYGGVGPPPDPTAKPAQPTTPAPKLQPVAQPPATVAAPTLLPDTGSSGLGNQSVFEKPADVSWNDFLLAHLASLGQGAQQIGHGAYDYGRSAGNYGTAGGLDVGLAKAGQYAPDWVPSELRPDPSLAYQQAQTKQARQELGPIDYASMITGWRGGPARVLGPAANAVAGTSVLNPALQFGAYKTGESMLAGDEPATVATKGATGFGTGLGFGILAKPVAAVANKVFGGGLAGEEEIASQASDAAKQANSAEAKLNNMPISVKDLGFKIGGDDNPTYGKLQDELANLAKVHPADDPAGAAPIINAKFQNAVANKPEVVQAQTDAATARTRADTLGQLADWNRTASVPGADVTKQAAQAALNPNLSPGQQAAYLKIANAATASEPSELLRQIAKLSGAGVGGVIGHATGIPYVREVGIYGGSQAGDWLASRLAQGGGPEGVRQAISQAYPALSGDWSAQPGVGDQLLRLLYGQR
jgi:hypothetical protein